MFDKMKNMYSQLLKIKHKGHIRKYETKEPLCGREIKVIGSNLYKGTCPECFELAKGYFRNYRK